MTLFDRNPSVQSAMSFPEPEPEVKSFGETYRPTTLGEVVGQDDVVRTLRAFVARPYPCAFLFSGATGTGKTSAALALRHDLGVNEAADFFHVQSGNADAAAFEEIARLFRFTPWCGWRLVLIDEADMATAKARQVMLSLLERIPSRTVVVLTTNHPEKFDQRTRDRMTELRFRDDGTEAAQTLADRVWEAETGGEDGPDVARLPDVVVEGKVSYRRVVAAMERLVRYGMPMPSLCGGAPDDEPDPPAPVGPEDPPSGFSGGPPSGVLGEPAPEDFAAKLGRFAARLQEQQAERYRTEYPNAHAADGGAAVRVRVVPGKKYTRVDVGTSGKYMVVNETGEIFGIKGYGVIHRGHSYGTLETIDRWDWSGYTAAPVLDIPPVSGGAPDEPAPGPRLVRKPARPKKPRPVRKPAGKPAPDVPPLSGGAPLAEVPPPTEALTPPSGFSGSETTVDLVQSPGGGLGASRSDCQPPDADYLVHTHSEAVGLKLACLALAAARARCTAGRPESPWPPQRLTLRELVAMEALRFRSWGNAAGELLADTLDELADDMRFMQARTPGEFVVRRELWEKWAREKTAV